MVILYFVFCAFSMLRLVTGQDGWYSSVWLSAAAYCGKDKYETMILDGPAKGFTVLDTFSDAATDLEGYIGILPAGDENTVYVVFRGSSSTRNWIADFEVKKVDYPGCLGCQVHHGFYQSVLNVKPQIEKTVNGLYQMYPNSSIIFTGHSYGAATAMLMALEITAVYDIRVINFGQPRIGNPAFAAFYNTKIADYTRITHNRDIVPHVPPIKEFDYMHSCGEVFETVSGELQTCLRVCEDPECADQYKLWQTNSADHEIYLGHTMNCENSIA